MNKDQVNYQIGRISDQILPFLIPLISVNLLYQGLHDFQKSKIGGMVETLFGLYVGLASVPLVRGHFFKRHVSEKMRACAIKLENVPEIFIEDSEGLELLLDRTIQREPTEWGTFLNVELEHEKGVVKKILSPYLAEEQELISGKGKSHLGVRWEQVKERGFNGIHHYHPSSNYLGEGNNFCVSSLDRARPLGWINLLTFNFHGKPQVIAFNRFFSYFPEDKKDPTRLVRVGPKEILKYLENE